MDKKLKKDIIEWDVTNWGRFIDFIEKHSMKFNGKTVLEIGAHNGGLSLYYALKGAKVVCSDLNGPTEQAHRLHEKYGERGDLIDYAEINATNIPDQYKEKFDYITFKSVLAAIGSWNNIEMQKSCIACCKKCLKPGGRLIFADNMAASPLHRLCRWLFVKWGRRCHYATKKEIYGLLEDFRLIDEQYVGLLGCFGRSEKGRNRLARFDVYFDKFIPDSWKYIGMYIYEKEKN